MDLLQHARELYARGRMHDALEAAQAACDRAPKDPDAWWLLGLVGRHAGLPVASEEAFRRSASLDAARPIPHRVDAARFLAIVREALAAAGRHLSDVRVEPFPADEQVRAGVDPDALSVRIAGAGLVLFQVNHENRCATEEALRALVGRSIAAG